MRYAHHDTRPPDDAERTMLALESAIQHLGLDSNLLDLLKLRVSQINGCAWCAGQYGDSPLGHRALNARAEALAGWRQSVEFDERERALLSWTDTLALGGAEFVDADHERLARHFDEHQCLVLTTAIVALNEWSRLAARLQPDPLF